MTHEARRLPLSPPDYHAAYALTRASDSRLGTQMPYLPPVQAPVEYETTDAHSERYMRPNAVGVSIQAKPHLQQQHPPPPSMPQYLSQHGYYGTGYGQRQMDYGPIGAPVLPSLRANQHFEYDMPPPYQHPSYGPVGQQPVKEERSSTGGVSAVLDYDTEMLAEFAAGMAQYMYGLIISRCVMGTCIDSLCSVQPTVPVSPAFRKFIAQLLGATRLPCATVLLALYYMEGRMRTLSNQDLSQHAPAEVYRMLTVGLMIASKYLDDNTFHNRSWADVSGIAVAELNSIERAWLLSAGWKMHVNPDDHIGYLAIVDRWHRWSSREEMAARAAAAFPPRMQLPPIDTSGTPYRGAYQDASSAMSGYDMPHHGMLPYGGHQAGYPTVGGREGPYSRNGSYASASSGYGSFSGHHTAHHDQSWGGYVRGPVGSSPPSAPETGPATPDYLNYPGAWSYNFAQPAPHYINHNNNNNNNNYRPASTMLPAIQCPTEQEFMPYGQTPFGSSAATTAINWSAHPVGCRCAHCCRRYGAYPTSTGYAA